MEQINKSTLEFLSDLKKRNDRDWFQKNRNRYLEAKSDYEIFVQAVINGISTFDPILKGLEVTSCTYRINRDIRFSNDKTLYKTHLGAFIVRGGKQNGDRYAGYYVHVEPGNNSMIAGGAYMPPALWLRLIREKIDEQAEKFLKIIENKEFVKFFGKLEGEKLKTAPKGFPKDHPHIELLKLKSFLVVRMISDKEVISKDCFDLIIRASKVMKPLNDFLNDY
ncbi:MAG: hypothetical protein A2V50_01195 [Bacteroidetes bacterium RBG_19FT_COMBO_42_10]|nr:MAG: hypothetical protein A2V50_01195 [Bacteroidetes bacterium RBG_19FT_COMBO_42_10]